MSRQSPPVSRMRTSAYYSQCTRFAVLICHVRFALLAVKDFLLLFLVKVDGKLVWMRYLSPSAGKAHKANTC